MYVTLALIIGPNVDGEVFDFSVITLGDLSSLSNSGADADLSSLSDPVSEAGESSVNNANEILLNLRKKNCNRVIIGTLNINSVASKLDQLRVIIGGQVQK